MEQSAQPFPRHVAIIMDGNGRWAKQRSLARIKGHCAGVDSCREIIKCSRELGIEALTLFAFSSENWRRPKLEVQSLLNLLLTSLENELESLEQQQIRLRFIGNIKQLNSSLCDKIATAEMATRDFSAMQLVIAINYGGRWDITSAARQLCQDVLKNKIHVTDIDESLFSHYMSLTPLPEPDLFIRTSGEYRISNFLLWSLAYTELYFTDVLWPDFKRAEFQQALAAYAKRQRRFGQAS